ncbi:MAG: PTS transporter subunit EIIA [Phycisphaerales bacterium]|nr:cation:proton antiporter [Phycisphaerae bacterium]NNF42208.1 PTS transporter subunit EIIA [Phycisphaerales bacterium]NNM24794.1 PTS transporter subunit EIIA [Phycisphaerales bacterium]
MPELLGSISAAVASHERNTMLITVVGAIAAGAILIVLSHRLRVPAIVLLLLGGIGLGPAGVGVVDPESLGDGLLVVVSLAIGLILFEGGLTLDLGGYRSAPAMIKRLLTIGVATTWFTTAAVVWWIFDLAAPQAIVAGSLVIVTGPTVIAPLLKRIKVTPRLHSILHWEGVLIDPLGVFIALLCFEWVFSGATGPEALLNFGIRLGAGLSIGVGGGVIMTVLVRRKLVPTETINIFALAGAMLVFGIAEMVRSEAGLLSVTIAGFIFSLSGSYRVKKVREFKADITDLLIGTLFLLLAARLSFDQFREFGLRGVAVVALVMLGVRPLSIFLCSFGLDLKRKEKLFLSWVAPRGIVAASMASLVTITLEELDYENPRFVETFVYSVIISTIVIQGLTAAPLARWLGVQRAKPVGWMIVGAHRFGRGLAEFLTKTAELPVVLVDTNPRAVRESHRAGLTAIIADAREPDLGERLEVEAVGNLLALTDNEDLNVRLCTTWSDVLGSDHVFRCNPKGTETAVAGDDEDETRGMVVWPKLPRPSLIASELQRREANLLTATAEDAAITRIASPLIAVEPSGVVFDPDIDRESDEPDPRPMLYLQRSVDYLRRAIRPELVVRIEESLELRRLLERLVDRAVSVYPALPREETVAELIEREAGFPTALGHGVAVPHAYSPALDTRLCVVAQIPAGMDFSAHDGKPVRLLFMLLSPQGDPEGHLATLAEIARRMMVTELRERIMQASSPLEVIELLRMGQT